jgi:hypothetical protein
MKALKEKRISLRSLWRRGLVILSLFALVFASCGESNDDDGGGLTVTGGPEPYGISIITQPTNDSYMGLPLDLTGIVVQVIYTDGTVSYVREDSKFTTMPRWATGYYDEAELTAGRNPYRPELNYVLFYADPKTNKVFYDVVEIPDVIPIIREEGSKLVGVPAGTPSSSYTNTFVDPVSGDDTGWAYVSSGLDFVGLATQGQKAMRVDEKPTFAGLTLEAWYRKRDKNGKYIDSAPAVKKVIPFSLDDMEWTIVPYYENGNETGTGAIYVRLGRNFERPGGTTLKPDYGVTAAFPLEAVYAVTGIELETPATLKPFFYWQADTPAAWTERVRDGGAAIKVTYSDNSTRSLTVAEALYQNSAWLNPGPGYMSGDPLQPNLESGAYQLVGLGSWQPFSVRGIIATAAKVGEPVGKQTYRKVTTPQISYYYRGRTCFQDVPVYTTYQRLNVEILAGGDQITIDMTQTDNDYQGMTMTSFAKLLKVSAVFTSPTAEEEAELVLKFKDVYSNTAVLGDGGVDSTVTMEPDDLYRNFYSMDFGIPSGASAWGKSANVKNNATKAVRINYYSEDPTSDPWMAGITSRRRYANVVAEWINVER